MKEKEFQIVTLLTDASDSLLIMSIVTYVFRKQLGAKWALIKAFF